jgi:hypothetical protein
VGRRRPKEAVGEHDVGLPTSHRVCAVRCEARDRVAREEDERGRRLAVCTDDTMEDRTLSMEGWC